MRPYPLAALANRSQSWEWLDKEMLGPGNSPQAAKQGLRGADCWRESRGRVQLLGSLVPSGADEIRAQLKAWRARDPTIRLPAGLDDGGFLGSQTPVRDAIELLDLHIRLEPDPRANGGSPGVTAFAAEEDGSS